MSVFRLSPNSGVRADIRESSVSATERNRSRDRGGSGLGRLTMTMLACWFVGHRFGSSRRHLIRSRSGHTSEPGSTFQGERRSRQRPQHMRDHLTGNGKQFRLKIAVACSSFLDRGSVRFMIIISQSQVQAHRVEIVACIFFATPNSLKSQRPQKVLSPLAILMPSRRSCTRFRVI